MRARAPRPLGEQPCRRRRVGASGPGEKERKGKGKGRGEGRKGRLAASGGPSSCREGPRLPGALPAAPVPGSGGAQHTAPGPRPCCPQGLAVPGTGDVPADGDHLLSFMWPLPSVGTREGTMAMSERTHKEEDGVDHVPGI
nr:galectin-3-like [Equus caballus]